ACACRISPPRLLSSMRTSMETALRATHAMETPLENSRDESRSAWLESTFQFRCRWGGMGSAASDEAYSATCTPTAKKECDFTRDRSLSCSVGLSRSAA